MKKLKVALLSGGISSEREVSLAGGDQVFEALNKGKYQITRYDPKFDLSKLVADANDIDIALILLHGPNGEDGRIQGFLDLLCVPYQGAGVLGSALAMNKTISKQIYEQVGLPIPQYRVMKKGDDILPEDVLGAIGLPIVVKPVQGGSSIGMSIVKSVKDLSSAIETAFACDDEILFEQYIKGVEITGSVLGNADLTALPIVEIIPDAIHGFFNYTAKYTPGASTEICPARMDDALAEKAQHYAKIAHRSLCCSDYSRTDMILSGEDIFVLETNTIPGMTSTSLLPLAAKTAGIQFDQLLDRLIDLSLERSGKAK
jgi:D-alanine-D-alanine ligase